MIKVHYYEVWDDYSEDGRGGRIGIIGRFINEADALTFAIGKGNYGENATVSEKEFIILESIKEIKNSFSSEELNRIKDLLGSGGVFAGAGAVMGGGEKNQLPAGYDPWATAKKSKVGGWAIKEEIVTELKNRN